MAEFGAGARGITCNRAGLSNLRWVHRSRNLSKTLKTIILCQVLAFLLTAVSPIHSSSHTWKGSADSNLWSHAANWTSGVPPTAAETNVKLIFPATTFLNPVQDIVGLKVDTMTVTGGPYTFSGLGGAKLNLTGIGNESFINSSSGFTTTVASSLPVVLGGVFVRFSNTSGNLAINSVISGSAVLIRSGVGTVALGGSAPNTFASGMYCHGGVTIFLKPDGVNAMGGGNLGIGDPGNVVPAYLTLSHDEQIPNGVAIEIEPKGEITISNGCSETIGPLSLKGGLITVGPAQPSQLILAGAVSVHASKKDSVIAGNGTIYLGEPVVDFNVAFEPELHGLIIQLPLGQAIVPCGFNKQGLGLMTLGGAGFFDGPVAIKEGTLRLGGATAKELGSAMGATTIHTGAMLQFELDDPTQPIVEPLILQGGKVQALTPALCSGPVSVTGINEVSSFSTLTFAGVISGTGALMTSVDHYGSLEFTGPSASPFSGNLLISGRTLSLNKSITTAFKGNIDLVTTNPASPAKLLCLKANQLSTQSEILLGTPAENEWDLNNFSTTIRSLAGGGTVKLGSAALSLEGGNNTEFHGIISGSGSVGLVKNGSGIFTVNPTISGATGSLYTGQTIINGGTLVINDQRSGSVLVNEGGNLSGSGSVGNVTIVAGGYFSPGRLATLSLTATGAGNRIVATLRGSTASDLIRVQGTVQLSATQLIVTAAFQPLANAKFLLIDNDGVEAIQGTFAGLPQGAPLNIGGRSFTISYQGGDGNDVVITYVGPGPHAPVITLFTIEPDLSAVHLSAKVSPGYLHRWQKSIDLQVCTDLTTVVAPPAGIVNATFLPDVQKFHQYYRLIIP